MSVRTYANIQTTIWDDPEFVALPGDAQGCYFMLNTQSNISACGLLELTLRRWASYIAGGDPALVVARLNVLADARFVLIDKGTEELLVRTFIKWDNGYGHATRLKAILKSARAIRSPLLRDAAIDELDRLGIVHGLPRSGSPVPPDSDPSGSKARRNVPVESLSSATDVAPDSLQSATRVPVGSHSGGTEVAIESHGYGLSNVGTDPDHIPHSSIRGGVALASHPEQPPSNSTPWCDAHPGGTTDPCGPCKQHRLAYEADTALRAQAKADAVRDAAARRKNCPDCAGDIWLPDGAKCTHPNSQPRALRVVG